jgi:UDP-N-acetylglucosamine--N-acetylmuramyl-(pentapeptide) pyrophosphoryl-undecaprenol N-acetylglucosamine transferase
MGELRSMTVLFAGGGTGGHLMPGISVAKELVRRFPQCRVAFAGTNKPLERRLVESNDFEFFDLPSLKWGGSPLTAPSWLFRAAGGGVGAARLLRRLRPNIVVSLGGYAAVAPCLMAAMGRIPVAVMEQNAVPGKANRLLSWWAQDVYVPWPGREMSFPHAERVHVTGNPVRCENHGRRNRQLAARFGLNPHKRTLLVTGGSQGAKYINDAIVGLLDRFESEASWLQILHHTGEAQAESVRDSYKGRAIEAAVYPYIDDMMAAWALCDLALCRAGGTSLAEVTALGVPSVLVPLPTAAHDHQRLNAEVVAREGAAVIAEQKNTSQDDLGELLIDLLKDDARLDEMHKAGLRIGRPAAASHVVERLVGVMRDAMAPQLDLLEQIAMAGERG